MECDDDDIIKLYKFWQKKTPFDWSYLFANAETILQNFRFSLKFSASWQSVRWLQLQGRQGFIRHLPDGRNMEKKFVPSEVGSEKLSVEGRISQAGGRGKRDLRPSNSQGMKTSRY